MKRLIFAILALALVLPFGARADCPATPSWMYGRTPEPACLPIIDSGPLLGLITFDKESAAPTGLGREAIAPTGNAQVSGTGLKCTPCTRCSILQYDASLSNYPSQDITNPALDCTPVSECVDPIGNGDSDVMNANGNEYLKHLFIKNGIYGQAWRTATGIHTDVLQIVYEPGSGGWVVLQDGTYKNSDTIILQIGKLSQGDCPTPQACPTNCPNDAIGGFLIQGVTTLQEAAYTTQCTARSGCPSTLAQISGSTANPSAPVWVIANTPQQPIKLRAWIDVAVTVGDPNQATPLAGVFTGVVRNYADMELAITGEGYEPPFVRLSNKGWRDTDSDTIPDRIDNCDATSNLDQADGDADGVGDVCDNCTNKANAAVVAEAWQTTTGGQLDDDADGYGNQCDGDFNQARNKVDAADLALFTFAFGKPVGEGLPGPAHERALSDCNPGGTAPCDIYDLDNAKTKIDAADLDIFKVLFNVNKGPKCSGCPLTCVGDACP